MPRGTKAYGSKTAFILGMPTASPKEVVAAASRVGLKFSEGYVGTIRYNAKKPGTRSPRKRQARSQGGGRRVGTKTEFVMKMPGASAKDIVAAAKKAGMKLTERYVYVIRSADKAKGRKVGGRGGRAANGGAETDLRRAIAELGLTRARQVLQEVEAAFR